MKTALAVVIWMSIGMGITVAYGEKYHKPKLGTGEFFFLSSVWPAMIAAEVFRGSFAKGSPAP